MSETPDVHGPYGATPSWRPALPTTPEPQRFRMRQRLARLGASRPQQMQVLDPLFAIVRASHPKANLDMIERAYQTAEFYHRAQIRKSGDPYITHPLAVATILAELGMTDTTICAGLLHDTVEDTAYTVEQLTADFGAEVAHLVDGVTKLDKVTYGEAAKAETIRKMVVAMAKDIRVLVIKLADRLHNMRTIGFLRPDKQYRISRETLEIFAPLAHRLGMNAIKWELEDLSFSTMQPKVYDEIVHLVAQRAPQRDEYLRRVISEVQDQLAAAKIKATVYGRPKHYYSIYQKMVVRGRDFSDIYDLIGLRILVDTRSDCYAALGVMHVHWNPLPGRFKDYIAMPKFNLYQSLHTTVLGPEAKPVELQIRTHEMHRMAEYGVAAHWKYKEGSKTTPMDLNWVNQLRDWQRESSDPGEFLDDLRFEINSDEVYAFTPKGEVFSLPVGATPVDFAYSVHTQVGDRCIGARVNGRLVPLDSTLSNGDVVEILTSKADDAGPSRDWLAFVKSPRARNKIRKYFSKEQREESIERGKDDLAKQLRRQGVPMQRLLTVEHLTAVAESFNLKDIDSLYAAIGEGSVSAHSAVIRLVADEGGMDATHEDILEDMPIVAPRRKPKGDSGVEVDGDPSLFVKLAKCCTPVPGDAIIGFVTRMNGVSVHREDCPNVAELKREPERLIPVNWSGTTSSNYLVAIQVEGIDRAGMLADITKTLAEHKISITSLTMMATKDRIFRVKLTFETADPTHLKNVITNIRRIDGVYDVFRVGQ